LLGVHAATDFCFEWEWYGKMKGAFFNRFHKTEKPVSIKIHGLFITKGLSF